MLPETPILRRSVKCAVAAGIEANTLLTLAGAQPGIGALAFPAYTDAKNTDLVAVTLLGVVPVIAGAAVAVGDKIMASGTDGKCIELAGSNRTQLGWAITAAAADGDEFLLFMLPHNH